MKVIQETDDVFRAVTELNLLRQFDFLKMSVELALKDPDFAITKEILCQLNNQAVAFLCTTPGQYRQCPIGIKGTPHAPPHHDSVPGHMDDFLKYMKLHWKDKSPTHLASFALWRLNWIHPFVEGNGRTARATCYLVLCVKHGLWLPGRNTVTEQIRRGPSRYYEALRDADRNSDDRIDRVDVSMMEKYLDDLLTIQLQS